MANPRKTPFPPMLDECWTAAPREVWPGNVPSRTQALEALRGRLITVVSLPGARRLGQKLNAPERTALAEEDPAPLLREATVMRWRLAAARDLLPRVGEHKNPVALRALLVEVWQTLDALRSGAPEQPELDLAMDCAGEKLQQEAIAFTQTVREFELLPAPPPPPRARTSRRMTEALSWGATRAPLFVGLALLLGLSAVGTLSARQRTRALSLDTLRPASVPHTFILPDEASGTLLVRSTLVDVEAPEQRSWLRLQEARGLRVTRLGPGSYLVAPGNSGH